MKIKKYKNRKLYCFGSNSYIRLKELSTLLKGGLSSIDVVDHAGNDITSEILAKLYAEDVESLCKELDPEQLIRLIRGGISNATFIEV